MIQLRYLSLIVALNAAAQIPKPNDAPQPLPPVAAAQSFRLAEGYRMELMASEPLVREPSGLCWDERGRLYVCELHGYNLEGQYDIDELNKSGQLDREVRRIEANSDAKEAAVAETYGTIKLLSDTDGDGRMDHATVFADRLPPCYGIAPARGGLIVACAPDVMYLADRDGDGQAEVREKLFTGFPTGALERGINSPQRGYDHWIYFGRGHGGGQITGTHLTNTVALPGSDFRVRADGSAIEAVTGRTHTFGQTFTEDGDRFVSTTSRAGLYVTPLPWQSLARNPFVPAPASEESIAEYTRVFPAAAPHPWRVKRAEDPGFFKYYRDRYGASDSEAGGYFTSSCGPLVYQDVALPAECRGAYFLCEPAQNLIHRGRLQRDGPGLRMRRFPSEENREFLASTDQWFHPIHLAHGPDGAIWIVDMYREIIEDYSAVPRFLQQQYGLTNGIAHGRIWRLTHRDAPASPSANLSELSNPQLAERLFSPHFWHRQAASRLLVEHRAGEVAGSIRASLGDPRLSAGAIIQALYTLRELNALQEEDLRSALRRPEPAVAVHALRLASAPYPTATDESLTAFKRAPYDPMVLAALRAPSTAWPTREHPQVLLQLALTLGDMSDAQATTWLARLARTYGQMRWMSAAIVSSSSKRAGALLAELFSEPAKLGQADTVLEPLAITVGGRRKPNELAELLDLLKTQPALQAPCLRGLQAGLKGARALSLPGRGKAAFLELLGSADPEVRRLSAGLASAFASADPAERKAAVERAGRTAANLNEPITTRLAAVTELAVSEDTEAGAALLSAWPANTPKVREAILEAVFARPERLTALMEALEKDSLPASALTAFQRVVLQENQETRERAAALFKRAPQIQEGLLQRFAAALKDPRDAAHGEQVFREHCATCHQVRGIGFAVGPDLGAEFQRAEEATLRDVLAPNDAISAGFPTYLVELANGQNYSGILADETATSLTLKQPAGVEQILLRKDVVKLDALAVSLMPEALAQTLAPKDLADVITWLRGDLGGRESALLFDDESSFIGQLTQGSGEATLEKNNPFAGQVCLAVTPPQRFNPRINGWSYAVVEQPRGPDEFRYLRLAWRTDGGQGVMVELADAGRWPQATDASRRYYAGKNTTEWQAHQVTSQPPQQWRTITVDLWKDNGAFRLTGIAPTAMGGRAFFDRIELLKRIDETIREPK